ncbi:MAG: lipopolysaccharide heptosyltransferase I [Methylococcales bacterium]|jgi:heptosyltransferase I|nr:lipopolysaccharide heptosyltransferase I [Methylococcales bacterium]MBT7444740.1 lipopolysaccharide heptosyltransferase I [Methylococcales bacterium]
MKVLLVKTSSLGDVVHALPAITDAKKNHPEIQFDWVVEEAFSEIPAWHPAVNEVIPVAMRRWRKSWIKSLRSEEFKTIKARIQQPYDLVIDAQGLVKSALLTRLNSGPRYGLDKHSAREPAAAWFYQHKISVAKGQHAIERVRQLLAQIFNYDVPDALDYGLSSWREGKPEKAIVFFHATTWVTKHWPEMHWVSLAKIAVNAGFAVWLPWGNEEEKVRAERIAKASGAEVLPRLSLTEVAKTLAKAQGVIGVDTGLCHLAAALAVPSVTIYGATKPALTGTKGHGQLHLSANFHCSPCLKKQCTEPSNSVFPVCYETVSPEKVWESYCKVVSR